MCPDKETRNSFRRFQAENPDNFDYAAALIPIEKPLTPEEEARQAAKRNEKKKAQRAGMYVTDSMIVSRTSSMPKSALLYKLDKARYLDLGTCSNPVLFSQN